MAQYLDKTGLTYYTTKIKSYVDGKASGITKEEADATYAAKSVLASSSTNGLMSTTDKDALDSIIKTTTVGEYVLYTVEDSAITPEVFSIAVFSKFVNVAESDIYPTGIAGGSIVYNNTTNTFITASSTIPVTYHSVVDRIYGTLTSDLKGSTPFTNHLYIQSGTYDMYMYNGATLNKISPYIITSDEIDALFS